MYQEGGHIVLPEGGQQGLEDIQDVAPVGAQLSCVGPTYKQPATCSLKASPAIARQGDAAVSGRSKDRIARKDLSD